MGIMSSTFRAMGLNYLEFSQIAARCVRQALKEAPKKEAAARGEVDLMFRSWDKGTPAAVRGAGKTWDDLQAN